MSTRRMITSDLWEDDYFSQTTTFERLLWIGLITGCADDQGRFQDNAALIRSKVFPLDDIPLAEINQALEKFTAARKLTRYSANGKNLIQIVTWWKHQKPRWAGKSNYPAPQGWTDRERYHTTDNKIASSGWDSTGGYIASNTDGNIANSTPHECEYEYEVKSEYEGEGKKGTPPASPEPEPEPDQFDIVQDMFQKETGIPVLDAKGIESINLLIQASVTREDIKAGYDWYMQEQNKRPKFVGSLVGPIITAARNRAQNQIRAETSLQIPKGYTPIT